MGIAGRLRGDAERSASHRASPGTESPVQTEVRLAVILCRNYQEDKRPRGEGEGGRVAEKGGGGRKGDQKGVSHGGR